MSACENCGKKPTKTDKGGERCGRCKSAFYCSKKCQKDKWPKHKNYCVPSDFGTIPEKFKPLIEKVSENGTQFLVAKEHLAEGSKILADEPLAYVYNVSANIPSIDGKDHMFGGIIADKENARRIDATLKKSCVYTEDRIFFPDFCVSPQDKMTFLIAARFPWFLRAPPLRATWNEDFKGNQEKKTLPIRAPKGKGGSEQLFYEKVIEELKKRDPDCVLHCVDIFIIGFLASASLIEVHSLFKTLVLGCGIFPVASLIHYSCAANSFAVWDEGKLNIIAARHIQKGEAISIGWNAMVSLRGRIDRARCLYITYGVEVCACSRCMQENARALEIVVAAEKEKKKEEEERKKKEEEEKKKEEETKPEEPKPEEPNRPQIKKDENVISREDVVKLRELIKDVVSPEEKERVEMDEKFHTWLTKLNDALDGMEYPGLNDDNLNKKALEEAAINMFTILKSWKDHEALFNKDVKKIYMTCTLLYSYYVDMLFLLQENLISFYSDITFAITQMIDTHAKVIDVGSDMTLICSLLPFKALFFLMMTHYFYASSDDFVTEFRQEFENEFYRNTHKQIKEYITRLIDGDMEDVLGYEVSVSGSDPDVWKKMLEFYRNVDDPCIRQN